MASAQLLVAGQFGFGMLGHGGDVGSGLLMRHLAEQEHAQQFGAAIRRVVLGIGHPAQQVHTAGVGDAVLLAAARTDIADLDQAALASLLSSP